MDSLHPGRSFYMEDQKMKLGPEQSVQMPMKTVISLIVMVALGTFGFFQIQEKLNQHSTKLEIMGKDSELNTEFRIKWPRGLLGSLPADSEQFMLIEELYKQTDKQQERIDNMLHNDVNIKALEKAVKLTIVNKADPTEISISVLIPAGLFAIFLS